MLANADGNKIDTVRLFGSLIDNFPDMVHSLDEKGNIVFVNQTATQLLGYTEAELLGMNILQLYPPEIHEAVKKGFCEVKQTGEKRVESLFMAKDGTRIPVEIRTIALRDDHDVFAQTFSISRDLRKLKELQESLVHAGRLAAIGELAAGVAHDLNNPLTAVIFASAMLKKIAEKSDLPPEDLRKQTSHYSDKINGSASTMEHLTTRLRDFARGVKDQHTPVDLFDPIQDALFILDHRLRSNRVQVRCTPVKAKHWIFGDRNQIEQIFLNLFANASDAMAQTDVRELTVEITPHASGDKSYWLCSVRDTGESIPEQIQEQVFKAFFTTKPRGKGTGMGLSIARSIIKEHNGDIRLSSEHGKGTTFSLLLPIFTAPDPAPEPVKEALLPMKHALFLLALLSLSACTAVPVSKTLSAKERYADELLTIVPPTILFAQLSDPYAHSYGTPQQQEKAHANFMRNVDTDALDQILRNALLKHFTEEDLKALAAFYSTPEGRDCMAKVAPFAAEVVPACAHEAAKAFRKTAIEASSGLLIP